MPTASPLSDVHRAFLRGPRHATLASLDPDGSPRPAVIWFDLLDDDRILVNSRQGRRWPSNLLRDGRAGVSVIEEGDKESWLGLKVVVDEVVDDVERARDDIVALAHRYSDGQPSERAVADFRSQQRITFLLRIEQVHDHLEP